MRTGSKVAILFVAVVATGTGAFSPSRAPIDSRSTTRARRHRHNASALSARPAKSKEDDIEKTLSVILKHMEKFDDGAIADDSDDSKPAPKPKSKPAEEKASGESGKKKKGLRQRAKRKIKSVLGGGKES